MQGERSITGMPIERSSTTLFPAYNLLEIFVSWLQATDWIVLWTVAVNHKHACVMQQSSSPEPIHFGQRL
jgi:hypothetical protein